MAAMGPWLSSGPACTAVVYGCRTFPSMLLKSKGGNPA
jgi:hypothetical protein